MIHANISNNTTISLLSGTPLSIYFQGKHISMVNLRIRITKTGLKGWVPPKYEPPRLTEQEQIKRGEAGDPLLKYDMEFPTRFNDTPPPRSEYTLYKMVPKTDPKTKTTTTVPIAHNPPNSAGSNVKLNPGNSGFMTAYTLILQKQYGKFEQLLLNWIPPRDEDIRHSLEASPAINGEKLIANFTIKIKDMLNLLFLGFHKNLRSCWNTISHSPNLSHPEFHRILDNQDLDGCYYYPCYQKYWHIIYGDFEGNKYVNFVL